VNIFDKPHILCVCLMCFALCFSVHSAGQNFDKTKPGATNELDKKQANDSNAVKYFISSSNNIGCRDTVHKLQYANAALEIAKKINWEKGIIAAENCIGRIYELCCSYDVRGLDHFRNMLLVAETIKDTNSQIRALSLLATYYDKRGDYEEALNYYMSAMVVYKQTGDDMQGLLGNIGTVYANIGNYVKALDYYQRALKLLEENKMIQQSDSISFEVLLTTIGDLYVAMSQYDRALEYYDSAKGLNRVIKNEVLSRIIFLGLGNIYEKKTNYSEAIRNYDTCLKQCMISADHVDEAGVLNRLARIYLANNDIIKANDYARRSLITANHTNNERSLCDIYITMGSIYTIEKKYSQAITYYKNALAIAEKTGMLENVGEVWKQLTTVYKLTAQPALALDAYQNYIATCDSIYNQNKAKEMLRLEMQYKIDKDSLKQIQANVEAQRKFDLKFQRQQLLTYTGFGGLILLVLVSFVIWRSYSREKKANTLIQDEKQKSDDLLLNILPHEVAEELKQKGNVQAKEFEHVTVMFTDFVNFTAAGERLGAQKLVAELDTCFVAFDQILAEYNIEKIKTVGDAYLAVSGLPLANTDHANDIVKAAIEIRDYMLKRKAELGEKTFELRIGVHSGPVVAGIVGVRKFAYDIWGDTVNIAARMEQSSESGKVNISVATYELVKNNFTFTYRGEIDAKNKGKLKMYYVD